MAGLAFVFTVFRIAPLPFYNKRRQSLAEPKVAKANTNEDLFTLVKAGNTAGAWEVSKEAGPGGPGPVAATAGTVAEPLGVGVGEGCVCKCACGNVSGWYVGNEECDK